MRVKIEHRQVVRGLIFQGNYYEVALDVTFSEQERHVLSDIGLKDHVLLERTPPADVPDGHPDRFHLTIGRLLLYGPERYICGSVFDAKQYEKQLVKAMEALKLILDEGADPSEGQVFEL